MFIRYDVNGPRSSFGCGLVLLILGILLVSPFVGWLVAILTQVVGWILIVLGVIGIVVGILTWMSRDRQSD